ncbi:MAG TPA: DEAD/DEAH box helicase [Thermoanaerobaculia bacterium]|nr:DEAD/DEAH box helicase [Thermoanaerobaculia bacterium]
MTTDQIPHHPVPTTEKTFDQLGLSAPILEAIHQVGFVHPTPIQAAVIPLALAGRDIIALAQTGSGKTAAFVIPLAERLTHGGGVRALIISPTREIALQTQAFIELFGKGHGLQSACLIGGVKMQPQLAALKAGPDVVVATPGRLLDHIERRSLRVDAVDELVLDEGDHMLDLGFLPQIRKVVATLPRKRRTMMFSATMPPEIEGLATAMMHEPLRIDILPQGRAAVGISHRLYVVAPENKRPLLLALLQQELGTTLVFARRKVDAEWLFHILERLGHPVARIHADRSQGKRVQALDRFRKGSHRILVATDIAGRGIDVPGITHVINFDIPETVEDYIHRAGRTARVEEEGIVSTIATWQDLMMVRNIEATIGQSIPRCSVPGVEPWVEGKKEATRGRRRL